MSDYKIPKAQFVGKGWGVGDLIPESPAPVGEIWAYQEKDEEASNKLRVQTVKALYFSKGKRLSLHFHKDKSEIFLCALGEIELETITPSGVKQTETMQTGDRVIIPPCTPHRMTGVTDISILIEVSTHHENSDSYRIEKGD